MKLILTQKELIAITEGALKMHHVTGAALIECGKKLDMNTLAMTDAELLNELADDAKAHIESLGGYVRKSAINEYSVVLPEGLVCEYINMVERASVEAMPLLVKAFKVGKKHAMFFKKVYAYSKAMAQCIYTSDGNKVWKDVEEVVELSYTVENKIKEIFTTRG